ncbi:Glutamine-binding periplasmic protein precursor [Kingella potus]|uniref:Glutamine-binding periplasmic protein n=1 Tax=Kingella potus TaxID=265175 RepID=A0A377R1B5_9NEIS|nr:basic amino acid ABC transporter substrate-binding protein [Kingella potus]UOP00245.1 basic amino acid ABC transporter substrate-binding protein [Kingella potus]STR02698.1 Glutamine-binding periplasmic protein precursor [Kingella potus]
MFDKTFAAAAAALLLLAACSQEGSAQQAASGAQGAAQQEYIVATDAAYAPLEYMEGEQVVGFSRDILAAAGEKEGIKFNFVNTPFEGIFANVAKGDSDVALASITITDERKQIVDFTDPYFEATQMIVTSEKGSDIQSFADLKNRSVSVQNGTTADLILQDLQGKDSKLIRRFENMPLAFKELAAGGVDAAVGDNGVVQYFVANNPGVKYNMFVDPSFPKEHYGFALKKGRNDGLREKINKGLAAVKADGTYAEIERKWFKNNASAQAAASAASEGK